MEGASGSNPLCQKIKDGKYKEITHAGLGLGEFREFSAPIDGTACENLSASLDRITSHGMTGDNFNALVDASSQKWTSPSKWLDVIRALNLVEDLDGGWRLLYLNVPIMNSNENSSLWPGCLKNKKCSPSAAVFHRMFHEKSVYAAPCKVNDYPSGDFCISNLIVNPRKYFWDVQGILWTMASISTEIPKRLFSTFIPVADLNDPAWDKNALGLNGMNFSESVPVLTAYHGGSGFNGGGYLTSSSQNGIEEFYLNTKNDVQQSTLGPSYISPLLRWVTFSGVPGWLQEISKSGNKYKYNPTSNEKISLPDNPFLAIGTLKEWISWLPQTSCTESLGQLSTSLINLKAFDGIAPGKNSLSYCYLEDAPFIDYAPFLGVPYSPKGPYLYQNYLTGSKSKFEFNFVAYLPLQGCQGEDCNGASYYLINWIDGDSAWNQTSGIAPKAGNEIAKVCTFNATDSQYGGAFIDPRCLEHTGFTGDFKLNYDFYNTHAELLSPTVCGPSKRLPAFLNTGSSSDCDAAAQLMRAFALQCFFSSNSTPLASVSNTEPPELTSVDSFPLFYAWLNRQTLEIDQQVSRLYIENIPDRILSDFNSGLVGSGTTQGEHGASILETQKSIQEMYQGWLSITKSLQLLNDQIRLTSLRLRSLELDKDSSIQSLALQNLQIQSRMAQATIRAISGGPCLQLRR